MTTQAAPPTGTLGRRSPRPAVWSVIVPFLAGVIAMIGALVLIVVIRPLGWRLLVSLLLWIPGVTALILFSDGLDRSWSGPRRRWAAETLHWLSASFVALSLAVILGAFLPSLLSLPVSPSLPAAVGCDALIGLLAGLLTLVVTTSSGWVGGELSYRLRRWAKDERPERLRLPLRDVWSWRDAIRMLVLSIAGVLVTAGFTQLFVAAPSKIAPAADTAPKLPSVGTSIVLPLAVWFLTTGLVWFVFDRMRNKQRSAGARAVAVETGTQPPRRRATHASALAVGLAIVIGWSSAWVLDDLIKASLSARGTAPAVSIQSVPPAQRVAYLAQQFAPQFELTPGEQWRPTTVDWYVAHARTTTSGTFCVPGAGTEPQGCRELCSITAGARCAPICDAPDPKLCAPIGGNPYAVYYLYRDPTNTPNDGPARSGHDWAVIQYWIFYNYDSLGAGLVTQWHESDWEQISVLVERRGLTIHPVEVAFSEHCYGADVPATEISWNGSHPVSFVGLGSHGNYPTQNDEPIRQLQCLTRQTPRYLGAAGLFFNPRVAGWSLELPIAYLIGLRDQTGHAEAIADVKAISQQATPSIWSFHGYWGVDNNVRVVAGGVPTGAGPQSPQDQGPSRRPFRNMFCAPSWLKVSPTRATAWVCPS